MSTTEQEEEEVVYEEIPEPHVIETGDSVKVKQVLDDATMEILGEAGYEQNYYSENIKLLLMFISCVFAMVAQFYPIPFPQSRILLGVCCAGYFILSTILQFIITFVDKDTIIITKPGKENFSLIVQGLDPVSEATTAKMYVGRYFTEKGEFDQAAYNKDVLAHIKKYEQKKYQEFTYDHKTD